VILFGFGENSAPFWGFQVSRFFRVYLFYIISFVFILVYENLGGELFWAQHVAKSERLVCDCLFELIVLFGSVLNFLIFFFKKQKGVPFAGLSNRHEMKEFRILFERGGGWERNEFSVQYNKI